MPPALMDADLFPPIDSLALDFAILHVSRSSQHTVGLSMAAWFSAILSSTQLHKDRFGWQHSVAASSPSCVYDALHEVARCASEVNPRENHGEEM